MKMHSWFKEEFDSVQNTFAYKIASLKIEFTEKICKAMEEKGISRSNLAERLGVSKASISKLLNDGSNITLKRALAIADALDHSLKFDFVDNNKVQPFDLISKNSVSVSFYYDSRNYGRAYGEVSPTDDYEIAEWNDENAQNAA